MFFVDIEDIRLLSDGWAVVILLIVAGSAYTIFFERNLRMRENVTKRDLIKFMMIIVSLMAITWLIFFSGLVFPPV